MPARSVSDPAPAGLPCVLLTHEFAPFRGGVATYVQEIAWAAGQAGLPVEVWTVDYRGREMAAGKVAGADSGLTCPVVRLGSSGRLTPGGLLGFAWGVFRRRRLLHGRPVILLSVGAQMIFFLLAMAGAVSAKRATCFFHGSEILRFGRSPFWRWLARRFYARAGGFAVNSFQVEHLLRNSGLLPEGAKIVLAPCAVPSAFWREEKAAPPSPVDIPQKAYDGLERVLTVARLHPRKGQLEVARALTLLPAAQRERIIYQMVGGGDLSYLLDVADVCRAGGVQWECLGGLDDTALAAAYRQATLYVQASLTLPQSVEGFGITFLEASFHGCPVAAFRSGGVGEAVRDGETGLLVPGGDIPALAAAIGRLLGDPASRREMGEAGRAFAGKFSWAHSVRVLLGGSAG